jgi:hypothetical protein
MAGFAQITSFSQVQHLAVAHQAVVHPAQSSDKAIQDSIPTSEDGAAHSCHAAGAVASTQSMAATHSTTRLSTMAT